MNDTLTNDHAEVDALLRGLTRAFDGGDAREVFEKLDYLWARLAVHIRAEHLRLFPALLAAADAAAGDDDAADAGAPTPRDVREAVERLREDHDFFMRELATAVNGARALAARGGEDGDDDVLRGLRERVLAVAERLAEHNRVEEEQVYRWPEALLNERERADLSAGVRREIENIPPRFSEGDAKK